MNKEIYLKVVDEILTRLPLSLLIANDRVHSSNPNSEIDIVYEYCIDSCDLLLQTIINNFSTLRSLTAGFQMSWLRFISILATNANMLVRGTHVHNNMLDMIASLIKILRVPNTATTTQTQPNQSIEGKVPDYKKSIANSSSSQTVSTNEPSSATKEGGGWLTWWATPVKAAPNTNQPIESQQVDTKESATKPILLSSETTTTPTKSSSLTATTPVATNEVNKLNQNEQQGNVKLPVISTENNNKEVDDSALLFITWKTACSLYQSLPVHLRIKYPQLVVQITSFIEKYEKMETESEEKPTTTTTDSLDNEPYEIVPPSNRVQVV